MSGESLPSGVLKVADLLPCPFCGESNARVDDAGDMPLGHGQYQELFVVHCGCGVEGTTSNTPTIAIEEWNRRASPPPQATGALSEAEIPSPSLLAELGDGRKVYGYTAREVKAIVAALSSAKREAEPLTEQQIHDRITELRDLLP